jgi:muramidase (phage lysozyme)
MLDAIAWSEGTASDADGGYGRVVRGTVLSAPNNPGLVGQSNVTITNFTQHPNILVQVQPGLNSTAAGRYQFLNGTWTGLNLTDFGARNQDIGAVMLLQQAGSINPLLTGNVALAASNANGTWASLPNSPYGQPTRQMADFQTAYNNAFAACHRPPAAHIF